MPERQALRLGRLCAHVSGSTSGSRALASGSATAAGSSGSSVEDRAFVSSLDGSEQRFVVIWPAALEMRPAVAASQPPRDVLIALHGHGSDRWQFVTNARGECAGARSVAERRGMVYVSPDYRAGTSWMGPEAEADLVQLIRQLREGLIPAPVRRIVLCGGSMGATGALAFTTLHPSLLDGVVSLNGMADMVTYHNFVHSVEASYGALGGDGAVPQERDRRSAVRHAERLAGLAFASTTGGQDESVPPESVLQLVDTLKEQQPSVLSIHRAAVGHETDFADTVAALDFTMDALKDRCLALRGSFVNSLQRFHEGATARVAFMGGSITEMDGFRPVVCDWLQERFQTTAFNFVSDLLSFLSISLSSYSIFLWFLQFDSIIL